ncbi:MAG: bifunctional diguanylate cyclase/phosphodiesterase [Pseudomonadota bacterium]
MALLRETGVQSGEPAIASEKADDVRLDAFAAVCRATSTHIYLTNLETGETVSATGDAATGGPAIVAAALPAGGVSALLAPDAAGERDGLVQKAVAERAGYKIRYAVEADGEADWVYESGGCFERDGALYLATALRSVGAETLNAARLAEQANKDDLTGQLNRAAFCARLSEALNDEAAATTSAYLLIAIDDLGGINAEFGFEIADEVIRGLSARIRANLKTEDVLGRVAGNKFGVILFDCGPEEIRERCADLMNAVRGDLIATAGGPVSTSISIGAAPLAADIDGAEIAMVRGEAALNHARKMGPSSWTVFTEKIDRVSQRKRNAEVSDLILSALNERRITLAYQPIVTDVDETPSHYECLIRMRDVDGGVVPAPEFIPAAERLGLVHLLDRRVLELATATLNEKDDIKVNVNVSWETIKDPVWVEGYLAHLRANARVADRITVELTETQAIDAFDATADFVAEIKELGCQFAIDDFGAGYTSFRNLKALDIDMLKIDGSFVSGVASSRENQLFVRTLLDLARNFEVRTVAEWVDSETDALMLKGLGVDYLQGFLIGVPELDPEWAVDAKSIGRPPMQRDRRVNRA